MKTSSPSSWMDFQAKAPKPQPFVLRIGTGTAVLETLWGIWDRAKGKWHLPPSGTPSMVAAMLPQVQELKKEPKK